MKQLALFLFFSILILSAKAQLKVYDINQLDSLQNIEQKQVMIFIYTDWCRYCESMKHTSFKNQKLIDFLNDNYYTVILNGEANQTINYGGKTFKFLLTGKNIGEHEFVKALTLGKPISYPNIYIFNTSNEVLFNYSGYISGNELLKKLEFITL
ncbi:thioredoxin family protein [Pedobacter alpinus]|uniref:Thioredoxin family protein n=1 Tax=Pedobacter alpinus TaxID=1590643 RepID=A0ABW5TVQ8_9SPHI